MRIIELFCCMAVQITNHRSPTNVGYGQSGWIIREQAFPLPRTEVFRNDVLHFPEIDSKF